MTTIDQTRLSLMHRYWNASNYLTIGQIYLQDNPLLKEPLRPEQRNEEGLTLEPAGRASHSGMPSMHVPRPR